MTMIHTRSSRPTTRLSWTRRFPLTRRTGDSRTRNVTTTGSQTRRERWSGSSALSGCMTAASCVKRSLQRLIYILQCIHLQILINLQLDHAAINYERQHQSLLFEVIMPKYLRDFIFGGLGGIFKWLQAKYHAINFLQRKAKYADKL